MSFECLKPLEYNLYVYWNKSANFISTIIAFLLLVLILLLFYLFIVNNHEYISKKEDCISKIFVKVIKVNLSFTKKTIEHKILKDK